jgi:4-amino-4-deoxy-L-arabinose transferase-like glycosyltransferase
MRLQPIITACLLAGVTLLLYGFRIADAPLSVEETVFAAQAQTLDHSRGLFFHVQGEQWLQPIAVYAQALTRAVGAGDMGGRIASTIAGAVDVALVFAVVRIAGREWIAVAAALLLLLTPAHWTYARLGTDAIFPSPFVLVWLLGMLKYFQRDQAWALGLAGTALGVGTYAHQTAPLTMAWLLVASIAAVIATRGSSVRALAALIAAYTVLLLPAALWFAQSPGTYLDTFGRWAILAAHIRFPLDGLRAQVNWNTLSNRASLFWSFLDPSFLFFAARGATVAPMLACSAILIPLGTLRLLASSERGARIVVLSAAVVPVLIAATFGQPLTLANAIVMMAVAAVLAAAGLESLQSRSPAWSWLAGAMALVSVVQLLS